MDFRENTKLLLKEDVFQIVGAAIEVLNQVGHGFNEKPYENALVVEFGRRKILCQQQKSFVMSYKGCKIGEYIPDLIVFNAVIVDAKTVDRISDVERGQMLDYLRITGLRVGVILNFRHPKLEWERIVL
jgi:GxxExxY protein